MCYLGRKRASNVASFSLIELLVSIGIIALLAAMLLPTLKTARELAKQSQCASNVQQLLSATHNYLLDFNGYYPPAYDLDNNSRQWDAIAVSGEGGPWQPGILWYSANGASVQVQRCPTYAPKEDDVVAPYANLGYGYNASYIGRTMDAAGNPFPTVRDTEVKSPSLTLVFADGEHEDAVSRLLFSPQSSGYDSYANSYRHYGTVGFRHAANANVGYADGHCKPTRECYKNCSSGPLFPRTGFLSYDNSAYDLE